MEMTEEEYWEEQEHPDRASFTSKLRREKYEREED
jgi:hypothetical protein